MSEIYCSPRKSWRLLSLTFTLVIILSFISPFSVTPSLAIATPQPEYPTNLAITTSASDPPIGVPSFRWSRIAGAIVYRLQVDNDSGFTSPIFLDTTTRNLTYTPTNVNQLFSDGDWYWRVRVDEPIPVSAWSSTMQFHKTWATLTNKPTLVSPTDSAHLAFFDYPVFSWTRVIGAVKYRIQISSDSDFSTNNLVPGIPDALVNSIQPTTKLANGKYYWRVIPIDAGNYQGTYSDVYSFYLDYGKPNLNMVPTLLEPQDDSFPTFTPTFHWTAVLGAEHYRLEYTSDEFCDFTAGEHRDIRQTYYTPTNTFQNDFRYCWRVRVESGPAVGEWSPIWHFQKRWNLKPILLTPTNLYQNTLDPLFSWTPVPGAASYLIQIASDIYFNNIFDQSTTANTTYSPRLNYANGTFYWRVRPIDGSGNYGVASGASSFTNVSNSLAPVLVYPLYYYSPNLYGEFTMNPHEDRSVPYPIFIWHRLMTPPPVGGEYVTPYRIQVAESPYFTSIIWQSDTENTSATPTTGNPFDPIYSHNYFWKVCALNDAHTACRDAWSQTWTTQFTNTVELTPTNGPVPELLRPEYGQESVEATPLLEWWPFTGATQYQVEVSRDSNFSNDEILETVDIPAYSPVHSLAERSLGRTNYGTFYWRVRALTGSVWSGWSNTWRFQIASQSQWRYSRVGGSLDNRLIIAQDPVSDTLPSRYDLSSLFASQSKDDWHFGFTATITTTDVTFVLYLDLDHVDGSGATDPPERPYKVDTIAAHQPEYAIYIDTHDGAVSTDNTWVYQWNGNLQGWGYGQRFIDIQANIHDYSGYVELAIPYTAIGMNDETSSASLSLFSVDKSTGLLRDSVPSDPDVPHIGAGNALISRFSSVSEHLNLIHPPSTVTGDPSTMTSILPFFWDWPSGSYPNNPYKGSLLQADLDEDYTPQHELTIQVNSDTSYLSPNHVTTLNDIVGDNIYYWRVQPIYGLSGYPNMNGAWTGGWSFHRLGLVPRELNTSISFATPTFSWSMAEGASLYLLWVATDENFGNRVIEINTAMNSYTPPDTLANGDYYWKVQIMRNGNIWNDWSEVKRFTLATPTPTGLTPNGSLVSYNPTFCWNPLVGNADGHPLLTAWRYRIQVSTEPNFSNPFDVAETFNNCWTPTTGYADGTYYWRVAFIDGNSRLGYYSPSATFTKHYPKSNLISPVSGSVSSTPTFIWTPVDGAATYVLEVSWYQTFYPTYESIETFNTQYTSPRIYDTEHQYYWRVAIRDYFGRMGPFNDATIIIGLGEKAYLPNLVR